MQLFMNNFAAALAADLAAGDAELALTRGDMPAIGGGDWMLLTLEGAAGEVEIVRVTAHAAGSDICTVMRGQEGTAAADWPAGTKVENRLTAGALEAMATKEFVEDKMKNTVSLTGSGKVRKAVRITKSVLLDDPSEGRAAEFRVTMVGGGGGGYISATSSYNGSGGGGEGLCFKLYADEISWPIQIYVGGGGTGGASAAAGGSTSVLGRYAQGGSAGTANMAGRGGGYADTRNGYVHYTLNALKLGGDSHTNAYNAIGIDEIWSSGGGGGYTNIASGSCGPMPAGLSLNASTPYCEGGGASILGKGGDAAKQQTPQTAPGPGGGGCSGHNDVGVQATGGGGGMVLIEWYE